MPGLVLDRSPLPRAAVPRLDDDQLRVVGHTGGPLLVLAGPGTGKTTTLAESIVARLEDPVAPLAPEQVLALTFGRRAAAELRDRVAARVGGGSPRVATFHSFAYGLVRELADPRSLPDPQAPLLRLLSAPEQELRLRELIAGSAETGVPAWPQVLRPALPTRGFAADVRAVVARLRSLGLDPEQLAGLGRRLGQDSWRAVGEFADQYLDVLGAEGVTDYSELIVQAWRLASGEARDALRARYRAVYVDEYQDTDPLQVRLLSAVAGPQTTLVVVGDPDQAVYAFRGADRGGILRFCDEFRDAAGRPAPRVVLGRTRRFGPVLREACSAVLGRAAIPGLTEDERRRHRHPECEAPADGRVEVLTFDDAGAQAAHVAEVLRRAAMEDGVPWGEMAVLVRSGVLQMPPLRRALAVAGVPVEVAADELLLADEPAVQVLLDALRAVAVPGALDAALAGRLLVSPLGRAEPGELRRLGRALREVDRAAVQAAADAVGADGAGPVEAGAGRPRDPRPSEVLLRDALLDPALLGAVEPLAPRGAAAVRGLAVLLGAARRRLAAQGTPGEVLWALWDGTRWPGELRARALAGGPEGRRADRDLDALAALFGRAERAVDRAGTKGVAAFVEELAGQVIPADALDERGVRPRSVRLLTAHRAKGLQWRLVVVAGVQEETWPDVRRRSSLLDPDRIGPDGLVDPPAVSELLAEERRLFYVACSRARERLVVTAVRGAGDDAEQPSRFLDDLPAEAEHRPGRPARRLALPALVARLRQVAADPGASPELRGAAVERLAVLAAARRPDGSLLAPAADPATWWGVLPATASGRPLRDPVRPVPLSGSSVTGLDECPLRWFLTHDAKGFVPGTQSQGVGRVVHALADAVARGELPADAAALGAEVDRVWAQLRFDAPWQAARERAEVDAMIGRLLAWHASRPGELLGTELEFAVEVAVRGPGGAEDRVRLRGTLDRVDVDADGRAHVADLKTGKEKPTKADADRHLQLGVYQRAVAAGAAGESRGPGSVRLVMLRHDASKSPGMPLEVHQPLLPLPGAAGGPGGDPGDGEGGVAPEGRTWLEEALAAAASALRLEEFPARPGTWCGFCDLRRLCPAHAEGEELVR